jgi:hypothetical protein
MLKQLRSKTVWIAACMCAMLGTGGCLSPSWPANGLCKGLWGGRPPAVDPCCYGYRFTQWRLWANCPNAAGTLDAPEGPYLAPPPKVETVPAPLPDKPSSGVKPAPTGQVSPASVNQVQTGRVSPPAGIAYPAVFEQPDARLFPGGSPGTAG